MFSGVEELCGEGEGSGDCGGTDCYQCGKWYKQENLVALSTKKTNRVHIRKWQFYLCTTSAIQLNLTALLLLPLQYLKKQPHNSRGWCILCTKYLTTHIYTQLFKYYHSCKSPTPCHSPVEHQVHICTQHHYLLHKVVISGVGGLCDCTVGHHIKLHAVIYQRGGLWVEEHSKVDLWWRDYKCYSVFQVVSDAYSLYRSILKLSFWEIQIETWD